MEQKSVRELLEGINEEDRKVASAVHACIPQIEKLVNEIVERCLLYTSSKEVSASNLLKKFFGTFASFFQKKQAGIAILFMLLLSLIHI